MQVQKELKVNPEYQNLIRQLTTDEYCLLNDSIKREGQHLQIIANAEGLIIDGHHRYRACQELGLILSTNKNMRCMSSALKCCMLLHAANVSIYKYTHIRTRNRRHTNTNSQIWVRILVIILPIGSKRALNSTIVPVYSTIVPFNVGGLI